MLDDWSFGKVYDKPRKTRRQLNIEGIAKMKALGVLRHDSTLSPDSHDDILERRQEKKNKRRGIKPRPKHEYFIRRKPKHYDAWKDFVHAKETLSRARQRFLGVKITYATKIVDAFLLDVREQERLDFEWRMYRVKSFRAFRKRRDAQFAKWGSMWRVKEGKKTFPFPFKPK